MSGHSNILLSYGEDAAGNGLLTNLEAYWKLDESSGTIIDAHASYDSIAQSGLDYSQTGILNTAIGFSGAFSGDYISMGDVLDFDSTESFSFSCWFNLNVDTNALALITKRGNGGVVGYSFLRLSSSDGYKIRFVIMDTGGGAIIVDTTSGYSTTSTWYHAVMTYDGSKAASGVTIYVNGSSVSLSTVADTLTGTTLSSSPFNIGNRNNGGTTQGFNGEIDEVGIWSRELSGTDVTALYNSGSALAYSSFTS